jgi:hypothetical protein
MVSYKELLPRSQRPSYSSNDGSIDFLLKIGDGMELVQNSVSISGRLDVFPTGGAIINKAQQLYLDHYCGVHALFDDWNTEMMNGISEHLSNYGRYIKMHTLCNKNSTELATSSKYGLELKCGQDENSPALMAGPGVAAAGTGVGAVPFNFRPRIAINRSNRNIKSKEVGDVVLSFRLVDPRKAFSGDDLDATTTYSISDLKLHYIIQPASSEGGKLTMNVISSTKHSISSELSHLEIELPIATESVSHSYCETSELADDDLKIENPDITKVRWSFNDSNQRYISYELDNDQEILLNYIYSMGGKMNHHDIKPLNKDSTWGTGLSFLGLVPAKTKVGLDITSNADSTDVKTVFSFYSGLVEV